MMTAACATADSETGEAIDAGDEVSKPDARVSPADASDPADATVTPLTDATPVSDLSPDLDLPDPSGQVCATPGSLQQCPSLEVCRFYNSSEGRCESCQSCGNLNALCNASDECDILFSCFQGRCANFCTLGSFECGPPDDCIDIGHPTKGACKPF